MLMENEIQYRRLRAPRGQGEVFAQPPLAELGDVLARNLERSRGYQYDFGGRSLAELSRGARRELVAAALHYTAQYRDVATMADPAGPIVLAGHQPELFHPGVWFKNFALGAFAHEQRAVGINLQIDSDAIKSTSIRVPTGSVERPQIERVAFDRRDVAIPFEERPVLDREMFTSFGDRVRGLIRPLVADPLVEQLWPVTIERMRSGANLGQCIAQARHRLEGEWGVETLELPQSRLGQFEAYHWFVAHLVAHMPRLWEVHNAALAEYRRVHHLRSPAHPIPDLSAADRWLEAPLWVWTASDPERRRVFVRQQGDRILLSDRGRWETSLDLTPDGTCARAAEQLAALAAAGVKLRTRALLTTMFARLFLGDVFLHGIGGAKYDQVTDVIMHRFLGLVPPEFVALSATIQLPVPRERITPDDQRRIAQELRELQYHPERFVDLAADLHNDASRELTRAVAAKHAAIHSPNAFVSAQQRHAAIEAANATMQRWVESRRQKLLGDTEEVSQRMLAENILSSREYAFCLFPQKSLRKMILELIDAKS